MGRAQKWQAVLLVYRIERMFNGMKKESQESSMKTSNLSFILQALLAALFFGASAPIAKLLLGDVPPILMAAFLYLGSGTGISLIKLYQRLTSNQKEAGIRRPDVLWL